MGKKMCNKTMEQNLNSTFSIKEANLRLAKLSAEDRIAWALDEFDTEFALTTSFGLQSSVLLHMIHKIDKYRKSKIIWVDSGYLPHETYQYAEKLMNLLKININISQSEISPARMESLYGKLWETNKIKDLEKYNLIRKVEP